VGAGLWTIAGGVLSGALLGFTYSWTLRLLEAPT